jgi:hypothetical protein
MKVSPMLAGSGVPAAAEIEEQKKRDAGLGVETERQRFRRLCVPRICCCSKLETPRLKLTAHAQ